MKRTTLILAGFLFNMTLAHGAKLTDFKPFQYEVLFTNPVCKTYKYNQPVMANNGEERVSKTKNAYCKGSDSRPSTNRANSPHQRLVDWIRDDNTKEIFLAYLSFSNRGIAKELCNAIKNRGIKVTLVFDSNNESDAGRMATANSLKKCQPGTSGGEAPLVVTRGNVAGLGYAHNKLFFVNPFDKKTVKLAYSSGNMSSGTSTHHENWHFVTTSPKTHFSQAHHCLMEGMLNYAGSKKEYVNYIKECRNQIETEEEEDIQVFFVPGEGTQAMNAIAKSMRESHTLEMAAHRFSNGKLISLLGQALKEKAKVKLVVDDDMYYTGVYGQGMGRNMMQEFTKVDRLRRSGMKVQYVETYADDVFEPKRLQLQHNKFIIFHKDQDQGAVFAGAGNFTTSAFTRNFENFYHVSIPEVYQAFKKQYEYMWNELSTHYYDMPVELVLP